MKLNLLYNSNNLLSGFLNVEHDPTPNTFGLEHSRNQKVKGYVDNLDWIVEDSECTNIIAEDVLSYFPGSVVDNIIDNWVRKLRKNGTLIVGGIDLFELSKGITNRYIDLVDANLLLYGQTGEKKSVLSGSDLEKALKGLGLKIIKNRCNSYKFTIEAVRP